MYIIWTHITEPIGNNEFHFDERIALWSEGKIFIPSLIQWTVDDLEEGSEIVFEEVENNELKSCTWLKHFIQTDYHGTPVYIFDNHNHALTFWYIYVKKSSEIFWKNLLPSLIHIDQHADTKKNNEKWIMKNEKWVENFVNQKTNVGNFISAALYNNIIDEVIQIRTNHALHHLDISSFKRLNVIVDIDMDFREDKTDQEIESDFIIIRKLMDKACLITIATSPYFMNQKRAIELIKRLLQ